MNNYDKIHCLVDQLNEYRDAYYNRSESLVSDKEYDELFDQLQYLEKATGIVMANSPTQTVGYEVKSELPKVTHSHPMMSLDKTKLESDLEKFSSGKDCILSLKMDGLTILNTYDNEILTQSETRGNGIDGELVTHNAKVFENLPIKIPFGHKFEIEGEAIITYKDFEKINATIANPDDKYKNPRNLASGSVRQLDSKIAKDRHIKFVAWKIPFGLATYSQGFELAEQWGFEVVPWMRYNSEKQDIHQCIEILQGIAESKDYPIDGIVITYDNIEYGKSLGMTGHHPRHSLAFKFEDEIVETTLEDIEWTMGKTGVLTPVAIFSPVEIDGTTVNRASIHNVTVMRDTLGTPYINQKIGVCKKNMIIPYVSWGEKLPEEYAASYYLIPNKCPICGGKTEIHKDNDSEVLVCANPDCAGKLLGKLSHFVSRDAINIDGLSEATIQFLLNRKWVSCFKDLYHLKDYTAKWSTYSGFGKKSVEKFLAAIEKSRIITLPKFLYALSIPLVGKSASDMISKAVDNDFEEFMSMMTIYGATYFNHLPGVGNAIIKSLDDYFIEHCSEILELSKEFTFEIPKTVELNITDGIAGKTFVITGSVERFANRNALKKEIEAHGGKVSGSISTKSDYLICNEISSSEKCKKAQSLKIPIISEEDFLKMLND